MAKMCCDSWSSGKLLLAAVVGRYDHDGMKSGSTLLSCELLFTSSSLVGDADNGGEARRIHRQDA
jgi:hypothetical protein